MRAALGAATRGEGGVSDVAQPTCRKALDWPPPCDASGWRASAA